MGPLTDKCCIVGVGQTAFMRPSHRSTLSMAAEAVRKACDDAGLKPADIDGITSYNMADAVPSEAVAHTLGIRPNYAADIYGGGSSTEALIAHAVGLISAGYCKRMVVFRSMNGRSGRRPGGQAPEGPNVTVPVRSPLEMGMVWGMTSPAQRFSMTCMRYMKDYGLKPETLGRIAIAHRKHATLNPKSIMKDRGQLTMDDYLSSRWIVKPFRLFDCCLETDVSNALIVTSADEVYDLNQPPVFIMGGTARTMTDQPAWNYGRREIHKVGGAYGHHRLFGMSGVTHEDIDLMSSYDAFTFTSLVQVEAYGFAPRGEAAGYIDAGYLDIDGRRPHNTSGGHLSEGYTHGISMVIENVRQLRHRADDACPRWQEGIHTYDRSKGCRQVRKANIAACLGWGSENQSSSLILRR